VVTKLPRRTLRPASKSGGELAPYRENKMIFGIIGWVAVGLIVGFIARKMTDLHGDDPRLGIAIAAGGAVIAGLLYSLVTWSPVTAWNFWSILFATLGGIAGVLIWHQVRSRYVSRSSYTTRRSY